MLHRLQHTLRSLPPHLNRAALLLLLLPLVGTTGYVLIEGWSFLDALYMTVITLTTIGFGEIHPLSDAGRIFTMVLAVAGVGAIFYALIAVFQFLLEGELGQLMGVQRMKERIEQLNGHYILCGFGRVGEEICREFVARQITFVVIETNPEAIDRAKKRGYLVLVGDATNDEMLREARVETAKCLLAASDSDSGNTFIVLTARALNPDILIVSRAGHPDSEPRMLRAGAHRVFSPYLIAGRQMALSALQPMIVEFIDTLATGQNAGEILAEIEVSEATGIAGQTIHDLLHSCKGIVVLGVQKGPGQMQVGPSAETVLEVGDRVILMGSEGELERIRPASNRQRV